MTYNRRETTKFVLFQKQHCVCCVCQNSSNIIHNRHLRERHILLPISICPKKHTSPPTNKVNTQKKKHARAINNSTLHNKVNTRATNKLTFPKKKTRAHTSHLYQLPTKYTYARIETLICSLQKTHRHTLSLTSSLGGQTTLLAGGAALLAGGAALFAGGATLLAGGQKLFAGGPAFLAGGPKLLAGGPTLLAGRAALLA
jgi:hypothetical protein